MNYATIEDMIELWRDMTEDEISRAENLIEIVSAEIRLKGKDKGRDIDQMVVKNPDYALVAKSVVCDIVARVLMTSTDQEPMSQFSQAAGGYSMSGTFLVPGGGLFIKKAEWKRLGLHKQTYGGMDIYDGDKGN